jgi:hypothetical protein
MKIELFPLALNELLGRPFDMSIQAPGWSPLLPHIQPNCLFNAKRPNARINAAENMCEQHSILANENRAKSARVE